jgi:hypothetical protein
LDYFKKKPVKLSAQTFEPLFFFHRIQIPAHSNRVNWVVLEHAKEVTEIMFDIMDQEIPSKMIKKNQF